MGDPPPRKAKLTQLIRTTQVEQLTKLQTKHQQECDLLDDLRNFGKQRSQIDREYGLALQKLVQQYNKKDWPSAENDGKNATISSVWKALLDATEHASQARLTSSENYKNGIYDAAKNFRAQKDLHLKQCQDLLCTLQNEISTTVKDLTKAKKRYFELEQIAAGTRGKLKEIEERRKKSQLSIFKSRAGLEKASQKLEQKSDECNKTSLIARNEYILALATANAHQKRYYEVDLPASMRILDGDVYSKIQQYLGATSSYEIEVCRSTQEAYTTSLERSKLISREFSTRCFLKENPVFEWGPKYQFEPCEADLHKQGVLAEEAGDSDDNWLNREARKWAGRFVKENKQLQRLHRLQENLQNLQSTNPEKSGSTTVADDPSIQDRLNKCIEEIRRVEILRLKSDSKLAALRLAEKVDVDLWIQSAVNQQAKQPSGSLPSNPSNSQDGADSGIEHNNTGDVSFYDDDFDDTFDEAFEDDHHEDEVSLASSEQSRTYPVSCSVLYAYKGTRLDELTILPGDVVEVVEDGDLEQWVKAKDQAGRIGYVPENYLQFPSVTSSSTLTYPITTSSGDSVSCTDSESFGIDSVSLPGKEAHSPSSASVNSSISHMSSNVSSSTNVDTQEVQSVGPVLYAKAVYEYEGCTDEELSFPEGVIIRIITKQDNDVDDGWWKGELNGAVGVFPALLVEELSSSGHAMI